MHATTSTFLVCMLATRSLQTEVNTALHGARMSVIVHGAVMRLQVIFAVTCDRNQDLVPKGVLQLVRVLLLMLQSPCQSDLA